MSPYYNHNRRQFTAPGSEVDSYGAPIAPVLEPVSQPGRDEEKDNLMISML